MENAAFKLDCVMVSCRQREDVRALTLESLSGTDWLGTPHVVVDDEPDLRTVDRIRRTWGRAIAVAAAMHTSDAVLLVEDDLIFNLRLFHNLRQWGPLARAVAQRKPFLGSLYNPHRGGMALVAEDLAERYRVFHPTVQWGGQAFVMTIEMVRFLREREPRGQRYDEWIPRVASRIAWVYHHVPSLVEHRSVLSTWAARSHRARDFDIQFVAAQESWEVA